MELLIAILATWRISSLFARETGPMWVFSNFRAWLEKQSKTSQFFLSFHEGIECVWCNSIWIAIIIAIFLPGSYVLNIFAVSAGSIVVDSVLGKLNG